MARDPVAAAVAAVEQSEPSPRATVRVTLGSGRQVLIQTPADLETAEALALAHYVSGPQFAERLAEALAATSRPQLLVPDTRLVRPD